MRKTLRYAICLALGILPAVALAAPKNPLDGQPAVRHKKELRAGRFEIGPSVGFTLNRFLRHAILVGAKMEYHINDWLSVGTDVGYGIGMDTGLNSELSGHFTSPDDLAQWDRLTKRFADIKLAGDVRLSFTPMTGKMSLFSKIFFAYDFYAFAGFGFAMTKNNTDESSPELNIDAANEGFRPGAAWGIGMHLYFARFFSMGVELKDVLFADNEPGGDITRGLKPDERAANKVLINGDDRRFSNHFFVGFNFTFFFPFTPDISN